MPVYLPTTCQNYPLYTCCSCCLQYVIQSRDVRWKQVVDRILYIIRRGREMYKAVYVRHSFRQCVGVKKIRHVCLLEVWRGIPVKALHQMPAPQQL